MIVATEGIDEDVKEYVSNTGIEAFYIDTLTDLEDVLKDVFSKNNSRQLSELIREISWDSLLLDSVMDALDISSPVSRNSYLRRRYRPGDYFRE